MQKLITSIFFTFTVLFSSTTISDESLIGKTLYCDSEEVNYTEWLKFPGGFYDIAIHFVSEYGARVYFYTYIPDKVDVSSSSLSGQNHRFRTNLSEIEFYDAFPVGGFILNRQNLILKHEAWNAQCNIINTKYKYTVSERQWFQRELLELAKNKQEKIEAEIKSKNKI